MEKLTLSQLEKMKKDRVERNSHVLYIHGEARETVGVKLANGFTKSDVFLYAAMIKEIAERLD